MERPITLAQAISIFLFPSFHRSDNFILTYVSILAKSHIGDQSSSSTCFFCSASCFCCRRFCHCTIRRDLGWFQVICFVLIWPLSNNTYKKINKALAELLWLKLVVLISATLPNEILEMTSKFMTYPVKILVKRDELSLERIQQYYVEVQREDWKFETM